MSVFISAIMEHRWDGFSMATIEEIVRAATSAEPGLHKWIGSKLFKSPKRDYHMHGYVIFHLPTKFTLLYARHSLCFGLADRWGRLLMYKAVRHRFLSACKEVARVAGAGEILILPEGTILESPLRDGARFRQLKRQAIRQLGGPPDLDISRFYTKEEVPIMPQDRVHYFLVPVETKAEEAE
jgi:hypothetical protein